MAHLGLVRVGVEMEPWLRWIDVKKKKAPKVMRPAFFPRDAFDSTSLWDSVSLRVCEPSGCVSDFSIIDSAVFRLELSYLWAYPGPAFSEMAHRYPFCILFRIYLVTLEGFSSQLTKI